jgi:uncharacterized low-complexity protein
MNSALKHTIIAMATAALSITAACKSDEGPEASETTSGAEAATTATQEGATEASCGEGSCGESHKGDASEAPCGEAHKGDASEASCGEGKCS